MGKQHSSGPGNRRPGRPDSAPQRGGNSFNSYGRGGDERRGGSEYPSRPPFGRPAGKPGFGGRPGGDERRFERPRRAPQVDQPDDAADFMRGRLNKPDFRKPEGEEGQQRRFNAGERDERRSFNKPSGFRPERGERFERPERRFERNDEGRPARRFERDGNERPARRFDRNSEERPERRFDRNGEERPARRFERDNDERPARRFERSNEERPERRFDRNDESRPARRFERDDERTGRSGGFNRAASGESRPPRGQRTSFSDPNKAKRRFDGDEPQGERRFERSNDEGRPARRFERNDDSRFGGNRTERTERPAYDRKPRRDTFDSKPGLKKGSRDTRFGQSQEQSEAPEYKNLRYYEEDKTRGNKRRRQEDDSDNTIRLNRYIANAGICSRREADVLIESGEIRVNGEVVTELGYKVQPSDTVHYGKTNLKREKLVYVLLNKPKDFLTTTDDPEGRKTVMDLVQAASKERIFPVGRLDRNTTGLLLFTNDGEVAQKLSHPSHRNKKVYQVELDKPLEEEHLRQIAEGLELEDGKAEVDDVAVVAGNPKFVGVEIHIGRNRIVRRIFEHLGYEVKALDRVQYAGLTKKDLPRGNWRYLTEKEVIRLKYFM